MGLIVGAEVLVAEVGSFGTTAASKVYEVIVASVSGHGKAVVALAGGTTPMSVYRELASMNLPWEKVIFVMGDERWVPLEHPQSNYGMAVRELSPKSVVLPVPVGEYSDVSEGVTNYGTKIESQLNGGVFDLVLLGLGDDGHTASLFPESDLLRSESESNLYGRCRHPSDGTTRISLLPKPLLEAKCVVFMVSGLKKAPMVRRVLLEEPDISACPAVLWRIMRGEVTWCLDKDSASMLNNSDYGSPI